MGKEGDLWDDSALINAFDDAISNYKIMHSKGSREGSPKGGKAISSTEENLPAIVDESSEAERCMQENNSSVASNNATEMREVVNPSSNKENHSSDSYGSEHHISSSYGQHVQDVHNANSNSEGTEDYNSLLNQYYEIEEQRQKILQQLYQFGNWNHQDSGYGVECGTTSASHENQVLAAQAWCPAIVPRGTTTASHENQVATAQASCPGVASCCSFTCPCLVTPCTSLPACSIGICESMTCNYTSAFGHNGKSSSLGDGELNNTALGAAERALSSLKMNSSGISDVNKDKAGGVVTNEGKLAQETSSETDLSVVLNAWYSAGFYTGKYVSERSLAKK